MPEDYLRHWGLSEAPFPLDPDPRFAYERTDHREGLARILFGITQLGGMVAITADIGAGKTLLAQTLTRSLDGDGWRVAQVANPPRTGAALLGEILEALGLEVNTATAARRTAALRHHLAERREAGERLVLSIDEAQRLDARALDEVRMLTNPDAEGPGMPVVLLGQPELSGRIARQPQIAQRVVVRFHMGPMDADEVDAYIGHRTRVAGARGRIVSKRAAGAVHAETDGVPRLVNLLVANALFVGAGRGESQLSEDTVRDLAEDNRAQLNPRPKEAP